ncbi:MAG: CAF17-like 4Fe-4S cluster assembly/insertion protein YgfZ [Acidimicrobiales bacterium]
MNDATPTAALADDVRRLRDDVAVVELDRQVVIAEGDAVVDYLQGQLSQDVAGLEPGRAAWSFVLQPQGKVDAWFRVGRLDDARFVFDVDAGWADHLVARLERFRLRTPVTFEVVDWVVLAVRGAAAPPPAPPTDPRRGLVVPVQWPGNVGWDLIADRSAVDVPGDLPRASLDAMEVLRIEAGIPRMGAEMDDSTIPAETGVVPVSVSFSKGCYTGQELVARIDSRGGQTPRRVVGLVADPAASVRAGAEVRVDGEAAGHVTSVAPGSVDGRLVALVSAARRVEVPADAEVEGAEGSVRLVSLPLVRSGAV